MDADLIKYASEIFAIELHKNGDVRHAIEQKINRLIATDFHQLIYVLYKVDVAENKLKKVLQANEQTDAATIITDLIIERLQQKIDARKQFKKEDENIPADEKW